MEKLVEALSSGPVWLALMVLGIIFVFPLFFEEFFGLKPRPEMKRRSAAIGIALILLASVAFLVESTQDTEATTPQRSSANTAKLGSGNPEPPEDSTPSGANSVTTYSSSPDESIENAPVCESFVASPETIAPGGSAKLEWKTSGAKTARINHGIGEMVLPAGEIDVSPPSLRLYTLFLENDNGSSTCSAVVGVSS